MINIIGPCVIEDLDTTMKVAWHLASLDNRIIFKGSFDKANRTRIDSYRGVGIDIGISILSQVKHETGLRVTTDVHECWQIERVVDVVDVIQIPAMLSRQTDLLVEAGKTGKIVNIKKGQFMSVSDVGFAVEKVGHNNVWVTERGTQYGRDLVVDFRNLVGVGVPVIMDCSHTAGRRDMVARFARAALAFGVDGLFIEVHPNPDEALCDGVGSVKLDDVGDIIKEIK